MTNFPPDRLIRLLLIEDDDLDASLIRRPLEKLFPAKFDIIHARSFSEVSGMADLPSFQGVLLDLNLGDTHGISLVQRVHQLCPDAAIIVLTGLDDPELAMRTIRAGAQEFWDKNDIPSKDIVRLIEQAVVRKQVARSKG